MLQDTTLRSHRAGASGCLSLPVNGSLSNDLVQVASFRAVPFMNQYFVSWESMPGGYQHLLEE